MPANSDIVLKRVWIAAITAIVVFYTVVFIQLGTIWFFRLAAMKELVILFFFLLATFWAHERIAYFFNSSMYAVAAYSPMAKAILEGVVVTAVGCFFCVFLFFLPQYLFIPTVVFEPKLVRLGLVMTAVLSLFFYYFVERERVRKKLQEEFLRIEQLQKESFKAQLEALKNQVNPHFLFNSLNILSSLIHLNQDRAVRFLGQLAEVYRGVLDNSGKQLVPLHKELELADAYLYLLHTRFGDNLQVKVIVPAEKKHLSLPPATMQMLIENAIKHNGSTAKKPLFIHIYIEEEKLVVANNLQPRLEKESSTGLGLQNIINRYRLLTHKEVEIVTTPQEFIVKLPLLAPEEK